jgi:hypothetical protein
LPNSTHLSFAAIFLFAAVILSLDSTALAANGLDIDDETPITPEEYSSEPIDLFGKFAYQWQGDDGAEIMVFLGEFALRQGHRRMFADESVVWMRSNGNDEAALKDVSVFLKGGSRVIEPAGAETFDRELYVTLRSRGRLRIHYDHLALQNAENRPLYQRALEIRENAAASPRVETGAIVSVSEDGTIVDAKPSSRKPVQFQGGDITYDSYDDMRIVVVTGGAYLYQAAASGADVLELRADNGVIFLPGGAGVDALLEVSPEAPTTPKKTLKEFAEELDAAPPEEPIDDSAGSTDESPVGGNVRSVYLEGDVVLTQGDRMIRASRIYFDFEQNKALILDSVMRTIDPARNIPIYVRAAQIQQLSAQEYRADQARITTSEFYSPHYHVGAEKIVLTDRTVRDSEGRTVSLESADYRIKNATFNIGGVPLLYWPYAKGNLKRSETGLKRARFGYSGDLGVFGQTRWDFFSLLGTAAPDGVDATLRLDYMDKRGPGVGIDLDYEQDDSFGLIRSYYLNDDGEDNLGSLRSGPPDSEDRGRVLLRHRHYLPENWELTLETSYISDANFLEEFETSEFFEGKEQETLLYLKKQEDTWAWDILAKWRILDFTTQTEALPDSTFRVIGKPLLNGAATWFSENRVGAVRYRPDDRRFFDSGRVDNLDRTRVTFRGDTRQEITAPFSLGPVRFVPFGSVRMSAWDWTPPIHGGGGDDRLFATYGLAGSMYLWRVFEDFESELFDVRRLRHVIKADALAFFSESSIPSRELTPFTEGVEDIDDFDGVQLGLRQTWQTKRGAVGRRRTVDWITWDLEAGFFQDATNRARTHGDIFLSRPETSLPENYLETNFIWRISDSTALLYDGVLDWDQPRMSTSNVSLHVERSPRLSYFLGHRYIGETKSNLLGFGANYRLTDKYTLVLREQYDLQRSRTLDFTLTIIRKLPRWYAALTFDLDEAEQEEAISIAIWPEGIPEATLGSRRFTGVATSTGLRP